MDDLDEASAAYSLLLFVSGAGTSSVQAIRNVQALCEEHLAGRCCLTVVDVHENLEFARRRNVLATPTLMREWPRPEMIRVGDFSDHAVVLAALGLVPDTTGTTGPTSLAALGSNDG